MPPITLKVEVRVKEQKLRKMRGIEIEGESGRQRKTEREKEMGKKTEKNGRDGEKWEEKKGRKRESQK